MTERDLSLAAQERPGDERHGARRDGTGEQPPDRVAASPPAGIVGRRPLHQPGTHGVLKARRWVAERPRGLIRTVSSGGIVPDEFVGACPLDEVVASPESPVLFPLQDDTSILGGNKRQ